MADATVSVGRRPDDGTKLINDDQQQPATALARGVAWLSAALRLSHTVAEGCVEAALNLVNNALDTLPPPLRRRAVPYADHDLSGKVAIVTGGNAGIGFATAQELARRGAHVVIACRDRGRAEAAVQAIAATSAASSASSAATASTAATTAATCPPPRVESMPLDLGCLASVRSFAAEWRVRGLPLHLLVCNAGVMGPPRRLATRDGLEMQFQVNFLSHWLLAHLLLGHERERRRAAGMGGATGNEPAAAAPRARRRARPGAAASGGGAGGGGGGSVSGPSECTRVVVVSSVVHRAGPLLWGDMLSERSYEPYITYGVSKLATLIMAKELQRRFERHPEYGPHDSAVAIHPGIVRTGLANGFFRSYGLGWAVGTPAEPLRTAWHAFLDTVGQCLLGSTAHAADRMLHACLAPGPAVAGRYLAMGSTYTPDKAADDPAYAAELWAAATRLTGHSPHESLA